MTRTFQPPAALPPITLPPTGRRLVVLYDRDCAFCAASAAKLRRWDRHDRLDLMPLQDAAASTDTSIREAAATLPLSSALHVVDPATGRAIAGGRALLAILDELPGGYLLRPWATLPPTGALVDLLYGVLSERRQDLGWIVGIRDEVACPVHDEPGSAA